MTLAFSAAGTAVLRRPDFRTHLAVGALIGTSAMQANLMLIVAVISGANMNKATAGAGAATPASFQATEAFAAMLFMAYSTFTVFVYSWKDMCVPAAAMLAAGRDAREQRARAGLRSAPPLLEAAVPFPRFRSAELQTFHRLALVLTRSAFLPSPPFAACCPPRAPWRRRACRRRATRPTAATLTAAATAAAPAA